MCLVTTGIKQGRKHLFGDKEEITCYKVIDRKYNKRKVEYVSLFARSKIHLGKVVKSDRKQKRRTATEIRNNLISRGIHVFLSFTVAKQHLLDTLDSLKHERTYRYIDNPMIVSVKCRREDYIAHGKTAAVFTQVKYRCLFNNERGRECDG